MLLLTIIGLVCAAIPNRHEQTVVLVNSVFAPHGMATGYTNKELDINLSLDEIKQKSENSFKRFVNIKAKGIP